MKLSESLLIFFISLSFKFDVLLPINAVLLLSNDDDDDIDGVKFILMLLFSNFVKY
jgi:hypothetical protein